VNNNKGLKKEKGDGSHHHLTLYECQMTPLPLYTSMCILLP